MENYKTADDSLWNGRNSENQQYLHEKVTFLDLTNAKNDISKKSFGLLGYACDEGVSRNNGRVGAYHGPDEIKKVLAKMPTHLPKKVSLYDFGSILCLGEALDQAQESLTASVGAILDQKCFPLVLGGGHDVSYAHYKAIRNKKPDKKIGIINFDAHLDLKSNENGNHSGTPFYQIAKEEELSNAAFNYLCLGIRKDANSKDLFATAKATSAKIIYAEDFNLLHFKKAAKKIEKFISSVDLVYITIDLDGFSSAYAPGVSAPSPVGFAPDVVLESLKLIIDSGKLVALDIAEYNPTYDVDQQTAKLASALLHFVMDKQENFL